MSKKANEPPIALAAYEKLAERFAAMADTKVENALYERPATLSLLPDVRGLEVLDAGCGPGFYSEWLLDRGTEVTAIDVSPKMIDQARTATTIPPPEPSDDIKRASPRIHNTLTKLPFFLFVRARKDRERMFSS